MFFDKVNILFLVFVFSVFTGFGQLKFYSEPLKIPPSLTGNFGELRPDHFHTGLDFRTQQKTGIPVYSAAAGRVSRIVVSPTGYGKALYIEHSNGTTTVYGHLLKFRDDIEEYVRSEQYSRQSFAVDLGIPPGKFRVEKTEQIGLTGNSGSSGGPHLHFEVRDTETQDALNPLQIQNFSLKDVIPPRIDGVQLYPLNGQSTVETGTDKKAWPVKLTGKVYQINPVSTIRAYGEIGIAVRAVDYSEINGSPCGIYSAQLFVNGEKLFACSFDRIPFGQSRYLNSHIDYGEHVKTRKYYQKMWRERGNHFHIFETGKDRGVLKIDTGKVYKCEVILSDDAGNQSRLSFSITGKMLKPSPVTPGPENVFRHDSRNKFVNEEFELFAPNGAFYEDFAFSWSVSGGTAGYYSGIHKIHQSTTPLHKPAKIRILTKGLPSALTGKAVIVRISPEGKKAYAGGQFSEGWMETDISEFGMYSVVCDTIPPVVFPLGIKNNALTETNRIRFSISDDLSGIRSYRGMIDDQWALFEYDPKTKSLVYYIDSERITLGKRHSLELKVTDRVNNTTMYRATFWK